MRVEIRCCCTADLLGTVEVNEGSLRSSHITFLLFERLTHDYLSTQKMSRPVRSLRLEIGVIAHPDGTYHKALKAHNVPLATLQQISTFEPWKR